MIETPNIPAELLARAFRSIPGSGEFAWRPEDATAAINALADAGYAVMCGEVWTILEGGGIWPALPGFPGGIYTWGIDRVWESAAETWHEFCDRARTETLDRLNGRRARHDLSKLIATSRANRPEHADSIYYNIFLESLRMYEEARPPRND